MNMSFNYLCNDLLEQVSVDFKITGLNLDSRLIKKDEIFIALEGTQQHGIIYAQQAIQNGASVILYENTPNIEIPINIPHFSINNLSHKLSQLTAKFYHFPSEHLSVMATTGTNGKSSVAYGIASIFRHNLGKTGVIGTLGFGINNDLHTNEHTTPDAITTQKIIHQIANKGAQYLVLEASSHGLIQKRIESININTVIYTNLSHEHLDYHQSMDAYFEAKKILFTMPTVKNAIINFNDIFGKKLIGEFSSKLRIITYGIEVPHKDEFASAENIKITKNGYQFLFNSSWGTVLLNINLLGIFNIENVLAMLVTYLLHGGDFDKLPAIAKNIQPLTGRMQCFSNYNNPLVVVDFAHTPDALHKVLIALREHMTQEASLYCVFGCGGNRDWKKRPLMAKVAEELADFVIITDDNPRDESSEIIIGQIIDGFSDKNSIKIIPDRKTAIINTVQRAGNNDVVLVAGKGHETGQIIAGITHSFSDQKEVRDALC